MKLLSLLPSPWLHALVRRGAPASTSASLAPDDCARCGRETVQRSRSSLHRLAEWLAEHGFSDPVPGTGPGGLLLCRFEPDCRGVRCQAPVCRAEDPTERETAVTGMRRGVGLGILHDPRLKALLVELALRWSRRNAHLRDDLKCEFSETSVHVLIVANNLLCAPRALHERVPSVVPNNFGRASIPSLGRIIEAIQARRVTPGDLIVLHVAARVVARCAPARHGAGPTTEPLPLVTRLLARRGAATSPELDPDALRRYAGLQRKAAERLIGWDVLAREPAQIYFEEPEICAALLVSLAGQAGGSALVPVALHRCVSAWCAAGRVHSVSRLGRALLAEDGADAGVGSDLSAQLGVELFHLSARTSREIGRRASRHWNLLAARDPAEGGALDGAGDVAAWLVAVVAASARADGASEVSPRARVFILRAAELARELWEAPWNEADRESRWLFIARTLEAFLRDHGGVRVPRGSCVGLAALCGELERAAAHFAATLSEPASEDESELPSALRRVRALDAYLREETARISAEAIARPVPGGHVVPHDEDFEELMRRVLVQRFGASLRGRARSSWKPEPPSKPKNPASKPRGNAGIPRQLFDGPFDPEDEDEDPLAQSPEKHGSGQHRRRRAQSKRRGPRRRKR